MAWPMEPADAERRVWGDAEGVAVRSRWSWWWTAGIPAGGCGAFQAPRDTRPRTRRQDAAAPAGWKPAVPGDARRRTPILDLVSGPTPIASLDHRLITVTPSASLCVFRLRGS